MKKLIVFLLLNSILIPSITPAFADEDDAYIISQDEKAPFSGLLFRKDKAQELKNTVLERNALVIVNGSLEKSLALKNDSIFLIESKNSLLLKDNDSLATNLHNERTTNAWTHAFYFALGAGGMILGLYGLKQISK